VDGVTHVSPAAVVRDAERSRILESLGFLIVRVTNVDVYENLDGVLEMISDTLNR
jgi:very-short-patch-repair endonuclease